MKCKYCKGEGLPEHAVYCCWCGQKLKRDKNEIQVPKPKRKKDGTYTAQIMVSGQRVMVPPQLTEAKYYAVARAMRSGVIEAKNAPAKITLGAACDKYIAERDAILSPSSIYGYKKIRRNRFKDYADMDIRSIDYQKMINAEAANVNAKTLKNAWGFISSVLHSQGVEPPKVTLPQIIKKELAWLDDKQIKSFLKAVEGQPCELGALLGLHGLRRSEILAITPAKISADGIHVEGSAVIGENGITAKDTNKNQSSRRVVPIMIPRLKTLVAASDCPPDEPYIKGTGSVLYRDITNICNAAGLPSVGIHGLRRSFVSLGYSLGWSERECMAYGGWSDYQTMHKIYINLSAGVKTAAAVKMEQFYSPDK